MFSRRNFLASVGATLIETASITPGRATPLALTLPRTSLTDVVTVRHGPSDAPYLAMTFDDGPHPSLTPALLDTLKARDIRATFFVIGSMAARYPDVIRRMADEGHEIGNHTWSHVFLKSHDDEAILDEIDRTAALVETLTGRAPALLRPPYGALTPRQRDMVHEARGLPTVLWSVDPEDWTDPGSDAITARILASARPGAIVLSHDIRPGTVAAMPDTLDQISESGLVVMPMSRLLGNRDWASLPRRAPDLATGPVDTVQTSY